MGRGSYKREVGVMADKLLSYTTIFLLILLGTIVAIPVLLVGFAGLSSLVIACAILDNIWMVGILALVVLCCIM